MTSFTSLLSSIGGGPPAAPQPKQTPNTPRPTTAAKSDALRNGTRPTANNVVAGVKRKPEEQSASAKAKVIKTELSVPVRPPGPANTQINAKPTSLATGANTSYRGTARAGAATNPMSAVPKPVPKPVPAPSGSTSTPSATLNAVAKPKRGFASLMEKAKAAQEAAKAIGSSSIKHKPVEKLTKRERQRLEEAAKLKASKKPGNSAAVERSRSGTPVDAKSSLQKKQPEPAYKGTMRRPVERQEFAYKGTMNKGGAGASSAKPGTKKGLAQDRYGGYASWSDLDDAEEEEEEDYESDASSDMMDAGFDDMEAEERRALSAAKKEDQEALAEEERHRREKLERKKKLQALSKSAAAKKRY